MLGAALRRGPHLRLGLGHHCAVRRATSTTSAAAAPARTPASLHFSPEVARALATGDSPVVALESTIITHGMPYPENYHTARRVEDIVRAHACTPATIAVIDGAVRVGLEDVHLEALARTGPAAIKCSRRDLPTAVAGGRTASTTVAATMIVAEMAGVDVFVTGGIGGVHRDGENTMDVSADLSELARTPVAVVSAGIKSILDIPRTLEYLETMGVPVLTLGADNFPAFFAPDSGVRASARVSLAEAAGAMQCIKDLGLRNGLVLAVPNPAPADAVEIEEAIQAALRDAVAQGVRGKDMTPFMLQAVNELTGGKSLQANIALIENNARVGCELALQLKRLGGPAAAATATAAAPTLLVFGGAVVDTVGQVAEGLALIPGTSNPGHVVQTFGGVGRNVAEAAARLGSPVTLVAAVGDDAAGDGLLAHTASSGVDTAAVVRVPGGRTAAYLGLHGADGALAAGLADMEVLQALTVDAVDAVPAASFACSRLVVCDANMPDAALARVAQRCAEHDTPLAFEPTSDHKAAQLVRLGLLGHAALVKPNWSELLVLLRECCDSRLAAAPKGDGAQGDAGADAEEEEKKKETREQLLEVLDRAARHDDATVDVDVVRDLAEELQRRMQAAATTGAVVDGGSRGAAATTAPALHGQHVLVSLGARGVVWAGPGAREGVTATAAATTTDAHAEPGSRTIAAPLVPADQVVNTSGAGDSLFAGTLHGLALGRSMAASIELGLAAAAMAVSSTSPIAEEGLRDLGAGAAGAPGGP